MDEFPRLIRARRQELGLTQKQLADRITLERSTVSATFVGDLERGMATAAPPLIDQLAAVLDFDRDRLYLAAHRLPTELADRLSSWTPKQIKHWLRFRNAIMET